MAEEQYRTFSEVRARLDEIVTEVRKKDLSLEKSLDLYEEAIELGNRCAELVDRSDYSAEEAEQARQVLEAAAVDVSLSGEVAADAAAEGHTEQSAQMVDKDAS